MLQEVGSNHWGIPIYLSFLTKFTKSFLFASYIEDPFGFENHLSHNNPSHRALVWKASSGGDASRCSMSVVCNFEKLF